MAAIISLLGLNAILSVLLAVSLSSVLGYLLAGTIADPLVRLEGALKERREAEEALQQANEKLTRWVDELEQRTQEISLLSEMGGLLQTCLTADEVYVVVAQSVQQLFSSESGAVYTFNTLRHSLEAVTAWGGFQPDEHALPPSDCWALRRGRTHMVTNPGLELLCYHLSSPLPSAYICVPMMAQGEMLGLLHLQFNPDRAGRPEDLQRILEEHKQPLAMAVAENIAFSLANLKLHETLYIQSTHDPLTGLFNRRNMEETLDRELHRMARKGRSLGIIMLDLDHFKKFNDTFGHQAGDALLRELGAFLQKNIRGEDFACRYGGEEFVIILPETPLEITLQRAEKLRKDVGQLAISYRGQALGAITLSLGAAGFPEHGSTSEAILRAADSALYSAKAGGRDQVVTAQTIF